MSKENLDDLEKKLSTEDLVVETSEDSKTLGTETEEKNENLVGETTIEETEGKAESSSNSDSINSNVSMNTVAAVDAVDEICHKSVSVISVVSCNSSSSSSSSSNSICIRNKEATQNRTYDRRLNPDAPVFVPRSTSSLAQKSFSGGEDEKDTSCGVVYDSIWNENSATPVLPSVHTYIRPKLSSSPMMMSSPMSRHYHSYGNASGSMAHPGIRGYLPPQGFYELRRTQSNHLAMQPLSMYASGHVSQSLNYANINAEKNPSPSMLIKSMPSVAFLGNISTEDPTKQNAPDGEQVEAGESNIGANTITTSDSTAKEVKEKSPIKLRGILVHKSKDGNFDSCDIKVGRGCCCSLM